MLLALLAAGSGGLMPLRAQTPDSTTRVLHAIIEGLPPAASVRLGIAGKHWTGRLAGSPPDSLTLTGENGVRRVRLVDVDTLWLQGPRRHEGLIAGAALGALLFAVVQVTNVGGEPRGTKVRRGLIVFAGSAALGMLLDGISDPWVKQFPE
jgi:hypothetical protein